jgi:hypothetical protein
MRPIKCLLLFAAVLAFAAMNATAMDDEPPPPPQPLTIGQLVTMGRDTVAAGTPHEQNWALAMLVHLALGGINQDLPESENYGLTGLVLVVDHASDRVNENNDPNHYETELEGENAQICSSYSHMGFLKCLHCCFVKGRDVGQRWIPRMFVYMDFRGLCTCAPREGDPPGDNTYLQGLRDIAGEVIDPNP